MNSHHNMTADPIPHLLRSLAVPVGVGFFFNTMFNVVDTYFGGRVSTEALAALSLSFPVFFLIIAIGGGISTGATALIGHALGARRPEEARRLFVQTLSFGVLHGLLLTVAGRAVAPFLFGLLGASGHYLTLAVTYMNTIFGGAVCFFVNQMCNAGLNASGDTKGFRNFLVAGFFANLVLDPWFLYGGLGLPAMGLPGIGRATVVVQFAGNLYLLHRVRATGLLAGFRPGLLFPRPRIYGQLARQGFPASLNMLTVALGVFVITWFLSRFGHDAVAAYGIAARLEQMALLPVMGLNIATLTLVAQNSGARNFTRVRQTVRTALLTGVSLTVGVAIVIFFGAPRLVSLFSRDPAVVAIGTSYLHIAAFIFCAYVILYICVFALQGLRRPLFAVVIGLYRQILAPLAVFWLLAVRLGLGVRGIWWGIFLVTWSAALVAMVFVRSVVRGLPEDGE